MSYINNFKIKLLEITKAMQVLQYKGEVYPTLQENNDSHLF